MKDALSRDFTSNRPGLLRYRGACLREGRATGKEEEWRFRSNKFSMLQASVPSLVGAGKPKNRTSLGPDYHRIRFSMRRENPPLPNRWKIRLPRNETFSETNETSLSLSLGHISFDGKPLHFPSSLIPLKINSAEQAVSTDDTEVIGFDFDSIPFFIYRRYIYIYKRSGASKSVISRVKVIRKRKNNIAISYSFKYLI